MDQDIERESYLNNLAKNVYCSCGRLKPKPIDVIEEIDSYEN